MNKEIHICDKCGTHISKKSKTMVSVVDTIPHKRVIAEDDTTESVKVDLCCRCASRQLQVSLQVLTRANLEEVIGERLVVAALWSTLTVNHCVIYQPGLQGATKTRAFIDLLEELTTTGDDKHDPDPSRPAAIP